MAQGTGCIHSRSTRLAPGEGYRSDYQTGASSRGAGGWRRVRCALRNENGGAGQTGNEGWRALRRLP